LKGIKIEKEGYKTLRLKVEDQALLESLRESLERRRSLNSLNIEDLYSLYSYIFPFIKHPVLKLAFTVINTIIELKS